MDVANIGLTQKEALSKLAQFGGNVIPEKKPPSVLAILLSQIKNPLVYLLLISAAATFLIGHYSDTFIIALAVFINTVLGFVQERKAGKALYELKKMIAPVCDVVRDGKLTTINVSDLVSGDAVYITQGDKVPADGKILSANRLFVDEAILTGESVAISKKEQDEVFMGTIVTSGTAYFTVEKTGANTQMGKIAQSVEKQKDKTPLMRQLTYFSKQLVLIVVGLACFVLFIGLLKGQAFVEMLSTAIALVVSAIPEGLLVGLTVVLAIGMQRILKRKGLVRNLASAETLGGVTTICVDKTGTLTQGNLRVVGYSGNGDEIAKQFMLANDLDDPLVISAHAWAMNRLKVDDVELSKLLAKHEVVDRIPFSPTERFFASLNEFGDQNILFVNGAPDHLLSWCKMEESARKNILAEIDEKSSQGIRVVGLAKKVFPKHKREIGKQDTRDNLVWVGMLYFNDPVREGVEVTLEKAKNAGIRPIIITGDYPKTAISVANSLGLNISDKSVIIGSDWQKMSKDQKRNALTNVVLFARTSPDQKLSIVEVLKENGEVVAMMGDGVNDAPALNKADIGIVVNEASDVSKEIADLVLLDSNFDTVMAAIEEGRGIFENIRKIVLYLMSTAFNEIIAVGGAVLMGVPIPVSAAQILWINIVTDGFPDLALTVEPKRKHLMKENPRNVTEKIVTNWMKALIAVISMVSGILALGLYVYVFRKHGDLTLARSVGFITLGINSLLYVFSVRTLTKPMWIEKFTENPWLLIAVGLGLVLQVLPFATSWTREFFGVSTIPFELIVLTVGLSLVTVLIIEVIKYLIRRVFMYNVKGY